MRDFPKSSTDKSESLRDLAARHAAARLTKKERNAELRAAGYDPDGEDGKRYRRFLEAARYGEFSAGIVGEQAAAHGPPQRVVLWDLPREEHAAWIAAGCGSESWTDYQRRLEATAAAVEAAGYTVVRLRATVADVLAELARAGRANDPQGRSAALAILARPQP